MLWYYYEFSVLLIGVLAVVLGLFVVSRNPKDTRYLTYGIFCFCLGAWGFAYLLMLWATNEADALLWARVLNAAALFIPVTSYHHIRQLLNTPGGYRHRMIWLGYGATFLLLLTAPTSMLIAGVAPKLNFAYWPNPGPVFVIHSLMFAFFATYSVVDLYFATKASVGRRRNHLRMLLIAIVLAYIGGSTNHPLLYDIPLPPIGNIFIAVYIVVFAYGILAFRLLDIDVIFKKSLIYVLLLSMLVVPCYLIVIWGQLAAFGHISTAFSMATLLLFIIVGFVFPKVRFRTEEALEKVLFQKRVDYRETLLRSSRDMVSIVDLKDLSSNLVKTVGRALGIEKVSLYLSDEVNGRYKFQANIGLEEGGYPEKVLLRDQALVKQLQMHQVGLVREELEMACQDPASQVAAETMMQLEAELSVPIVSKNRVIGILNLGHKEGKEIYSDEDLELLSTLANQAAIAIENARLYQNLKQSQDTLRRADRLSSLGLLTAGLAHEIRNPLVAIRTFTQLLPERYEDADFRENFQGLALKEVDRICGLITDLLSFARPSKPNVAPEDMSDVVEGIARILESQAKEKGVEIVRDFGASLPRVWIDREQMKQVFMNLILNAIQAMKSGGSIVVSTRAYSRNQAGEAAEFVQVEIRDSGIGIPEENLEHIFDPFFTNKDEGSGLGLSISHQIVQEHGGYITVESKLDKGTAFFINLPVGKPLRAVSNGHAHAHEANFSR